MNRILLFSCAAAFCCWTALAQVVCPSNFPSPSPIASTSITDIPATNEDIVTYTGAYAKATANDNVAFVQINANDQRVWFFSDTSPGLGETFYNRRYRADASSPWYWQYSFSPLVIQYQSGTSGGADAVLYSDTPKYLDSTTGTYYQFVMYHTLQPSQCNPGNPYGDIVLGFAFCSFSNDGVCWTSPRVMHRGTNDGPSFSCLPGSNTVPIESMSAIDGGDRIYLMGVEGNVKQLVPPYVPVSTMNAPHTKVAYAYYSDPATIWLYYAPPPGHGYQTDISSYGVYGPVGRQGTPYNGSRYVPYEYFFNMQIGYDAVNGDLYVGRAYPFPFDRGSNSSYDTPLFLNTPTVAQTTETDRIGPHGTSNVQDCNASPATLPNRVQVYKMHLGALSNLQQTTTGVWTLVGDYGGSVGYGFNASPPSDSTPIVARMTNVSRDIAAVTFVRDASGNLIRDDNGQVQVLGGDTVKLSKGAGPCQITGLEGQILLTVP